MGVDFSTGMLAQARRARLGAGWVRADARALPCRGFDLAVSFGALGHFLRAERPALFAGVDNALRLGRVFAVPAGAAVSSGEEDDMSDTTPALDEAYKRIAAGGFELLDGFVNHGAMACEAQAILDCAEDIDSWARRFAQASGVRVEPVASASFEWRQALSHRNRRMDARQPAHGLCPQQTTALMAGSPRAARRTATSSR